MAKTTSIKDVQQLAVEADDAARRAAQIVQPAHDEALKAARALRDAKDAEISKEATRVALAKIVEDGVDKLKPDHAMAANVLQQYLIQVGKRDIPASTASDGAYLWASLNRSTHDWDATMRAKVLSAHVLASRGEIDPGLATFPRDWSVHVEPQALQAMAGFLDADALAKLDRRIDKLRREVDEASGYVDALERATPSLPHVFDDEPAEAVAG